MSKIRFALALHNHQPIGNFDGVIESAYEDSYLPFLEVIDKYPEIPFSLHTSGCLLEWIAAHKPEYISRLRGLVERGQTEILGGGFYEPILSMIPSRDRKGQIRGYSEFLHETFGCRVRGMWMPERVWEQSLAKDIAQSGIEYTVLDDYHFRKAGLETDELFGYYTSEDEGHLLKIFPGSEPMRYMIPFQEVGNIIGYLRDIHERHHEALVVFADDGEKLGTWPETKAHVYEHGWIYKFFEALRENLDWIELCTLSQVLDHAEPIGQIALPDCSYREMTEWALPPRQLAVYDRLWHELDHAENGSTIKGFMKGGFWRNFKTRYREANEMYARMMQVSQHIERLCANDAGAFADFAVHQARQELYRGQCNCSYWHGAFGGLYLPHLRNAVYRCLISAENRLLDFEKGVGARYVEVETADFDFDAREEALLSNDQLAAFFKPGVGGQLYELDVRSIATNLGASLSRQPEAYHDKVRQAGDGARSEFGSIHDRVVFKQEGLDQKLNYDSYPRKSLIDHFYSVECERDAVATGAAEELGDFVRGKYEASVSKEYEGASVSLTRQGTVGECSVKLTKNITLIPGSNRLEIHYTVSREPSDTDVRFAVEFNIAALAAGADDRYFEGPGQQKYGQLNSILNLNEATSIGLVDEWLGIHVRLISTTPGGIWTFPIETVSQSEGGFELVHQSACVMMHWVIPSHLSIWQTDLELTLDTNMAEARRVVTAG